MTGAVSAATVCKRQPARAWPGIGHWATDARSLCLTFFGRLADSENFIVMYPNGFGIMGFLQHWNAGHCCGKAADNKVDDVGFVAAAIQSKNAGRERADYNLGEL